MKDSAYLFDTNLWLALAFPLHPGFVLAETAFESATSTCPAVFCRATQQSFLRLASTPSIFRSYQAHGVTNRKVLQMMDRLLASPGVSFREESSGVTSLWYRFATRNTASPKVWMDAYLAAFAVAGDINLVTFDADFRVYEKDGLRLDLLTLTS